MKTLINKFKKNDIFLSTKRNIIGITIGIVFLCLFIFATIISVIYSTSALNNVDHQIMEQQHLIKGEIPLGGKKSEQFKDVEYKFDKRIGGGPPMKMPPNLIIIVYNNGIFESMSSNLYFNEDNLPPIPQEAYNKLINIENDGYSFRCGIVKNNNYDIQILVNIDPEIRSIRSLTTTIILSLIILIIITMILSTYLASKVVKPIKEAYDKQVYFVQDASHEMRTPLAVIKGKLELLANSWEDTIEMHFEHISKIMSEIRGLEKLNSDLLLLSKEDLNLAINITDFKLKDFVDNLSEFYIDLADLKGKTFNVKMNKAEIENIIVHWDYDKIKRAIVILLENAFKYTGDDGEINLTIENLNKDIKISVKDNGIGIKKEEQSRIFDRFYRSESVRGENISGTGIGLSLLKSISKNFNIKLNVTSEYGVGTEFTLLIPKIMK